MNVLLTGASGFIGRNLTAALHAAGHGVVPADRRHGIDFNQMQKPCDWLPHLQRVDAAINCVGIISERRHQKFTTLHERVPLALFQACAQSNVGRVIQISALGSDATAFSAYHRSKLAADEGLRRLDLDSFVLRPSLVYGRGGSSNEFFMRYARLPLLPVIGDGRQLLQPVHISDVVATVMHCLRAADTRRTLDVVGREMIAFAAWLQRMRQAQGLPPARLLHVAPGVALSLARWVGAFAPLVHSENVRMLIAGCRAEVAPLAEFLGRMPLPADAALCIRDTVTDRSSP